MEFSKVDLTNTNQKIFAGFLVVGLLFLLHFLLPPLVVIFANLWLLFIMAIPMAFIIFNPMLMWNLFKQASWNLTKWFLASDKVGYMYRYHEYILTKIDKLDKNIESISGIRVKLERKTSDLIKLVKENSELVIKHQSKNSPATVIRTIGNKVNVDQKQVDNLLPKVDNIKKQENYLRELYNAWVADAEDLKYTLDAKAEEYKLMKEFSSATGNAKEFMQNNSEEYKIYEESLRQIEESVSQYTANVDNFERKVKPLLENISLNRTISEDEGLKLIEEYKQNRIDLKIE